ncbi:lipocalin family protein [Chryseobacterium daeguense]|uniref:lipocalin family protein n=1 Tax=Chryseobacterium daeguense TaxID=412438 RepID=UPI0003F9AA7D|nr:lipocalin family protein [Chryseobacterium daeguense]
MISCHSQKGINNRQSNPAFANYLLGTWKLTERKYLDGSEIKLYPLDKCEKKYTMLFENSHGNILLTKNYAAGKNCEILSNSGRLTISVSESSFSYFDLDLKRTEQYKVISDNKFSIVYNEILYGKVREIEDVYEREAK